MFKARIDEYQPNYLFFFILHWATETIKHSVNRPSPTLVNLEATVTGGAPWRGFSDWWSTVARLQWLVEHRGAAPVTSGAPRRGFSE